MSLSSLRLYLLVATCHALLLPQSKVVHGLLSRTRTSTSSSPETSRAAAQVKLNLFGNILEDLLPNNNGSNQKQQWPSVELPPDFTVPEPRPLTITESTDLGGFATASAGLALRLATGAFVLGWKVDTILAPEDGRYSLKLGPLRIRDSSSILDRAARPTEMIVLYDNESLPRCKRVREIMNLLDLSYECRPCFGADADGIPFIDDPNAGGRISGDNEIIEHLLENYGPPADLFDRKALWPITFQQFSLATSQLVASLRGNPGSSQQTNARADNANMKPIELWAYECSPFVRPVKEKLASLGLPHILVSCSRGSRNRDRMVEKTGRFQVPYLVDGNTGIEMFEGAEIVEYLEAVYTVKE